MMLWRRPKSLIPSVVTMRHRLNWVEYGEENLRSHEASSASCCVRCSCSQDFSSYSLLKGDANEKSLSLQQRTAHGNEIALLNGTQVDWKPINREDRSLILQPCWYRLKTSLKNTVLPEGYPHSVHPAYLCFSLWEFLHSLTDSMASVLTTQAMMQALGMGAASMPLAAGLSWVLKDGIGSLASILYSALISSEYDRNPKRYRFFAAILLHLSNLLEIASLILVPLWPGAFLAIGSLSYLGKHISMAASSATKFPFVETLSRGGGNSGDMGGKLNSQVTLAWALGIGSGVVASYWFEISFLNLIYIFAPVALIGIFSTYKACRAVPIATLDRHRTELIFDYLFKSLDSQSLTPNNATTVATNISKQLNSVASVLPGPQDIASIEGFLCSTRTRVSDVGYHEDSLMRETVQSQKAWETLQASHPNTEKESTPLPYFVLPVFNSSNPVVYIWFSTIAKEEQCLQGFYHAYLCRLYISCIDDESLPNRSSCGRSSSDLPKEINQWAATIVNETFPSLLKNLKQQGWVTSYMFIGRKRSTQGIIMTAT
jgi:hypothetical protein